MNCSSNLLHTSPVVDSISDDNQDNYNITVYCQGKMEKFSYRGEVSANEIYTDLHELDNTPPEEQLVLGLDITSLKSDRSIWSVLTETESFIYLGSVLDESTGCLSEFAGLKYSINVLNNSRIDPKYLYRSPLEISMDDVFQSPQKLLFLHLYKNNTELSSNVFNLFNSGTIENIFVCGWDITDDVVRRSIKNTLKWCKLDGSGIEKFIEGGTEAFFALTVIDNKFVVMNIAETIDNSVQSFLATAEKVKTIFSSMRQHTIEVNAAYDIQQQMFKCFRNRDYDYFSPDEHIYLKNKIAYAFFGPPNDVHDQHNDSGANVINPLQYYQPKQKKFIDKAYAQIRTQNNKNCERIDHIYLRVLCNVGLDVKNAKKVLGMYPIFVIKKCHTGDNCVNPCKIFIDHQLRVYSSWEDYKEDNKLPPCLMVLPKNGVYQSENDVLELEEILSPSAKIGHKILKATDVTSSVVGIGSGVLIGVNLIPAVAVAPLFLAVASASGNYFLL